MRSIITTPLAAVALELSALYGLVSPYDGRKLYTSSDRLQFGISNLSTYFHTPTVLTSSVFTLSVFVGLKALDYGKTWIHEIGHLCAMKALFVDVKPSITVSLTGGGECDWGGPARVLSTLGQHFSLNTAVGMVSAAGPLVTVVTGLFASALAYKMSKHRNRREIANVFALLSVLSVGSTLYYSMSNLDSINHGVFVGHDFQSMSNLFEIPRISLAALTMLSAIPPGYLLWKTLAQIESWDKNRL